MMTDLVFTMLLWWGVGAGLYLVWHIAGAWWQQRQLRKYWQHQPIHGPFRPNVRKVL